MNMFASATCAVDGERVIAFFGHAGLHCLDLDGNRIWERKLGPFVNPWGTASSPVIHGDLVVQNCESEETSFLLGVDKQSGETAWRTRRESVRGWSTPILVGVAGKQELIINSELGVNGYDPFTGKDLWFSRGERGRGTPTVVEQDGVVVAVSGRPGAMWATKPGGRGDVNSTHEVWRTTRKAGRDLGSPIIVGEYLFVVSYRPGVASVYDLKTGNELAKSRLAGNVSASPIAAGGHLYVPNESGVVFVIKADQSLEVVAKNQIAAEEDELFRASIAAADGRMYVRSDHALYCIEK
jgi:outer membrane protein assembly factor BamB